MSAAAQGGDGDPIPGLQILDSRACPYDLAGKLMTEHGLCRYTEERILGHMQIAAADPAAADLDHDLISGRYRIVDLLDVQGLADGLEYRSFHIPVLQ